jgi:hypothetical protein
MLSQSSAETSLWDAETSLRDEALPRGSWDFRATCDLEPDGPTGKQ